MADDDPQRGPPDLTDRQIDDMEFGRVKYQGAIIFSSYSDRFEYVSMGGFETGTLQELVPFDITQRHITEDERKSSFDFRYLNGGEMYQGRFFQRVEEGKNFEIRNVPKMRLFLLVSRLRTFQDAKKNTLTPLFSPTIVRSRISAAMTSPESTRTW